MAFYLETLMDCTRSLLLAVSGWIPRHVIGAVLVSLPAVSVLSHLFSSVHLPPQVALHSEFCCALNQREKKQRRINKSVVPMLVVVGELASLCSLSKPLLVRLTA